MTNVRSAWEKAIRTDTRWPSGSRVVRGTLLALAGEMRPNGVVRHLPRDVLAGRVGLPRRTLERHLARAVDLGWLAHRRAHRHVVAEYRAAVPVDSQHARSGMHKAGLCMPPTRVHRTGLCMPPGGALYMKENSVSVSEHLAVDQDREQRTEHDGSRVSLDHDDTDGSNEDRPCTPLLVGAAVARWEPTRPIGEIVVHGDWSSVTRAREAAA